MSGVDLSAFHRKERVGEFYVELWVAGMVRLEINATDAADARRKAEAMIDAKEIELYPEDVSQADVRRVSACPTMYLVKRDGKEMGVSHVQPGDEPMEPVSAYMASEYVRPAAILQAEGGK